MGVSPMARGLGIVEQLSPTVSPDNFAIRGTIEDNCSTQLSAIGRGLLDRVAVGGSALFVASRSLVVGSRHTARRPWCRVRKRVNLPAVPGASLTQDVVVVLSEPVGFVADILQ